MATRVSRDKARFKSGKKKGRLKPGCRYVKGDGAICGIRRKKKATKRRRKKVVSATRRRRTAKKTTAKRRRSSSKAGCYDVCATGYSLASHSPATGKRYRGRPRCASGTTPLRVVASRRVCPKKPKSPFPKARN